MIIHRLLLGATLCASLAANAQVMQRQLGDFDLKFATSPARSMAQGLVQPGGLDSLHGGLDASHASGWYFGGWAANLEPDKPTEVDSYAGFKRPLGNGHLGYELGKGHSLRASFSRRIQRPSPQDLNPYVIYLDQLNSRRGNPNLLPETTDAYELAWQLRKANGLYLSVTGFWRESQGGITDLVEDLGGTYLTTRANLTGARRRGFEAIASGKLGKKLSYNLSGSVTQITLDLRATGFPQVREGTTGSVRGTVTWQASKKDLFQLNGFYNAKQLLPQGYFASNPVLNVGYNRKLTDRFGVSLSVQDVLGTGKQRFDVTTAAGHSRVVSEGPGRIALLSLSYNLGGKNPKKKPDQPFDFDPGSSGPS